MQLSDQQTKTLLLLTALLTQAAAVRNWYKLSVCYRPSMKWQIVLCYDLHHRVHWVIGASHWTAALTTEPFHSTLFFFFSECIMRKRRKPLYYLICFLQTKNILHWLCLPQQLSEGNYSNATGRVQRWSVSVCVWNREQHVYDLKCAHKHAFVVFLSIPLMKFKWIPGSFWWFVRAHIDDATFLDRSCQWTVYLAILSFLL